MKISGFSFIRNGIKLGYPFIESIQSILPICDEFVVAVGNSDDGTREAILALNEPKIKIIDTIWDENLREGGAILAQQTNVAFDAITGDWGFYIQGDEVIHENDLFEIKEAMQKHLHDTEVEGLLFNYLHFYGNYDYVGDSKKWYRYEIRAIKNDKEIRSYRDAQGFRKKNKKLKVKHLQAKVFHYGWCRPPKEQTLKQQSFQRLYNNDSWLEKNLPKTAEFDYTTQQKLKRFEGSHPAVVSEKIKKVNWTFNYDPKNVKMPLKYQFIAFIEKLTGYRLWEYKNFSKI